MNYWIPRREWEGSDVFLIGGGPSLRGFDFDQLAGRQTIGCNSAYKLGARVCRICFFADDEFWQNEEQGLCNYSGRVVTTNPIARAPWLLRMPFCERAGLSRNPVDGLCGNNSGARVIHLALLLGARRVFLLGFDCAREPQATHWHEGYGTDQRQALYNKFISSFRDIAGCYLTQFPGTQIVNLNPKSRIDYFYKDSPEVYLS